METALHKLQNHLAQNVKTHRKALGLSQERLALDAGVDRTYVSQIERGISNPSLLVMARLAYVLGVDVVALLSPRISEATSEDVGAGE
jgi:transcriptional regulator with XRE-family HTH domain